MELIIGGRRYGKTIRCLEWVERGNRTDSYPFWDRVILTINIQEADRLRRELARRAAGRGWSDKEIGYTYNMVYYVEEWQRAHLGRKPVDVMLDNADMILQNMFRGGLKGVTWTAREGQPEDRIQVLDDQGGSVEL